MARNYPLFSVETVGRDRLQRQGERALLIAGVLWFAYAGLLALDGLDLYSSRPLESVLLSVTLLAFGTGLLGFYPRLAEIRRRLAFNSVSLVLLALVGLVVDTLLRLLSVGSSDFSTVVAIGFVFGTGLFGIASFSTETPSRPVGAILVGVFVLLVGAGLSTGWAQFVYTCLIGLGTMGMWYLTSATSREQVEHRS